LQIETNRFKNLEQLLSEKKNHLELNLAKWTISCF